MIQMRTPTLSHVIQANFHFLLHWNTPVTGGGDCLGLQDAFFDPDVLVDWDSVDTVRLSRKSMRRSLAPPGHQKSFVSMSPEEVCFGEAAAVATAAGGSFCVPNEISVESDSFGSSHTRYDPRRFANCRGTAEFIAVRILFLKRSWALAAVPGTRFALYTRIINIITGKYVKNPKYVRKRYLLYIRQVFPLSECA